MKIPAAGLMCGKQFVHQGHGGLNVNIEVMELYNRICYYKC